MTGQLESNHFFRTGDRVGRPDGTQGTIAEGRSLYAVVVWDSGESDEIDQFDPRYSVIERNPNN